MERSTVGSILRSTQAFCQQLCDKQTLDHGIAFYCERFPDLPEANQFREVIADDAKSLAEAYQQAESWFDDHHLTCRRWAPAMDNPVEHLTPFLTGRGFRRRTFAALTLTRWAEIDAPSHVRVLHARAMRAAFRRTFQPHAAGQAPNRDSTTTAQQTLADAYSERLDDPQFDMFVALIDHQPAGRGALYQVGDIGRVMELTVLAPFDDGGVDHALLRHTLALARRLALKTIVAQVEETDTPRRRALEAAGFTQDGTIVEFHR